MIKKFSVGEKVRVCRRTDDGMNNLNVGLEGIIDYIGPDYYRIGAKSFYESELEKSEL